MFISTGSCSPDELHVHRRSQIEKKLIDSFVKLCMETELFGLTKDAFKREREEKSVSIWIKDSANKENGSHHAFLASNFKF